MQYLNLDTLKKVRAEKMQKLESEMREVILSHEKGELFICPFCNYSSKKNKKGSAKMFEDSFCCFSCRAWRRI